MKRYEELTDKEKKIFAAADAIYDAAYVALAAAQEVVKVNANVVKAAGKIKLSLLELEIK